uniref:Uncharacterized protein n=1 Tax=Odontella aurita TaxID=265563 RepID=A0A7S4JGF3_9STRA
MKQQQQQQQHQQNQQQQHRATGDGPHSHEQHVRPSLEANAPEQEDAAHDCVDVQDAPVKMHDSHLHDFGQDLLSQRLQQHWKMDERPSRGDHSPEQDCSHRNAQDLLSWKLRQHWKMGGGVGGDEGGGGEDPSSSPSPGKFSSAADCTTAECTSVGDDDADMIDMEFDEELFERLDVLDF